ncbi:MAG TPA: S9 family peptidase [Candidatus Aminicenantes bacterium]|nr:MAG: S9 family peptidase [Candidatus Aminicenantes bacterium]HEK86618.1 S9 family peptidase [Candidatus Aminicenantes bacterium]
MKLKRQLFFLALLIILTFPVVNLIAKDNGQEAILSLERIFATNEFSPESFGPARWLKDGTSYTTLENSNTIQGAKDIVLYSVASGSRKVLVPASLLIPPGQDKPLSVDNYALSENLKQVLIYTNSQRVWRQKTRGDYWALNLETHELKKLGQEKEPGYLQFAKFSPDGQKVAYVYKNNIYLEDLASGKSIPLTEDGSENIINGTFDWVYEEEFSLRDGFRWSPDGQKIAFWQLDTTGVPVFYMINNTDSLYPRIISFKYPEAGETNSACRLGVIDLKTGKIIWLKVPGDPRNNYIPWMSWASKDKIMLQHLNRLQNKNEIMLADAVTGDVQTIFTDEDKAWVEIDTDLTLYDRGNHFLFTSERDGWKHIYSLDFSGKAKLLTPGNYDVISFCGLDEKKGWLYFIASPDNPTQEYLYRVQITRPGKPERITPPDLPGTNSYQLSPSCQYAFHTYSRFGQPPVIDLIEIPHHQKLKVLVENKELTARINSLKKSPVEFFRVDIGDGVLLDGWLMKPPDFDPTKKYPLMIYVYGEPAATTVRDAWGGNTYLYHLFLTQQGYLVMNFDNRGTPQPRGRDWRKIIYRQVGILASADQAAALRATLKKWNFIDPERIGIWGWSGGGQMTLNALFRYPDLYKLGIAVAFVSDQRLYDTIYQERYMGLPKDNPEGYKNGSPITFAHQLQGKLLIIHGTGDDNVHYQSFEKLVNELIANDKLFSMMIYPNRSHGIYEGKNTTLHLYRTMFNFIKNNL